MAGNTVPIKHEMELVQIKMEDDLNEFGDIAEHDHNSILLMERIKENVCQVTQHNMISQTDWQIT